MKKTRVRTMFQYGTTLQFRVLLPKEVIAELVTITIQQQ